MLLGCEIRLVTLRGIRFLTLIALVTLRLVVLVIFHLVPCLKVRRVGSTLLSIHLIFWRLFLLW